MAYQLQRFVTMVALFFVVGVFVVACGNATGTGQGAATTEPATGAEATTASNAGTENSSEATTAPGSGAETPSETTTSGGATGATETPSETTTSDGATGATETPSETTTGGAAGGTALTLPASCSNVELSYWNPFTGPDQPFMQQLVDSFNSANPNIRVTMTAQAEYNTQLSTAAAADQLPDVAIINEDQVATQAFRNVIRPIDQVVEQIGLSSSDFPEVAWNAGTIGGQQYAVPLSFVAMTMYYNNDLLKAAGLSAPPTNRAEFEAAAQAMTNDNSKGFMITTGFPVQQIFQQLLHQFGGTEFNAEGTEATWNSEAGVQALQWMVDAQRNYSEPNLEVDADLNSFKAGVAGMIMNGSWQIPNLTGEAVEFDGQVAPVPVIGDQPAVWAGGPLLTLPVHQSGNDECKDAAAGIFIRYLIDNSAEWAKGGNVPAFNQARQDPTFLALPQAVLAESVENPIFPPAIPGVGDAFTPLSEAITAVMGGNATDIKAALDDAATRANQVLAENKANYGDAPQGQ